MFTYILIALVLIIAGFLFAASRQPDEFTVVRSASMSAPPEKIFPLVNDLQQWNRWSPWAKLDPSQKTTFEGPQAGVGAGMHWEGNAKVGKGGMTITESKEGEVVTLRLDFLKPMKNTCTAYFHFKTAGTSHTEVTWGMRGNNNFMGKVMGLLMNCEKLVGGQYEKGLASIKAIAEA